MVDKSGKSLNIDDLSSVKKFEISDEAYSQKAGNWKGLKYSLLLVNFFCQFFTWNKFQCDGCHVKMLPKRKM